MIIRKSIAYLIFTFFFSSILAQEDKVHETFFDTNKYTLSQEQRTQLDTFLSALPKDKVLDVTIYGYCDDRGSEAYNLQLSQNRANTIREIIMDYGIKDVIIKDTDGKGELLLTKLDNTTDEVQRKLNRKVELIVALANPAKGESPAIVVEDAQPTEETVNQYKTFDDNDIMKGDRILLENILFRTNYSSVKGSSYKDLRLLAKFLKDHDNLYFKIQGHVCCINRGRDAIDLRTGKRNLSVMRAKFIYDYLAQLGIEKKRMRYEGFGSKHPLGGQIKYDKRVEILITYVKKKTKANP